MRGIPTIVTKEDQDDQKYLVNPNRIKKFATAYKTNATKNMANEKKTVTNAQVKVGRVTQTANAEFGIEDKVSYVMLIITDKGQHKMTVGEETFKKVSELTK